ncbi:hypothetical protein M5K25_003924 [Dendrobium thyrsiflorum]|uniref:Uncharacterized protein n=1 Tax=Dendrobium thyrsiflorum TaxID=117978 RepID=A0ABD0VS92_DENTH
MGCLLSGIPSKLRLFRCTWYLQQFRESTGRCRSHYRALKVSMCVVGNFENCLFGEFERVVVLESNLVQGARSQQIREPIGNCRSSYRRNLAEC